MAYSNTNKDKGQVSKAMLVKKTLLGAFLLIILLSSGSNIWSQWQTLKNAEIRNKKLESELADVTKLNKMLEMQIEYATSSAYKMRKSREYLGLGGPNDYWIKMPNNMDNMNITQEVTETNFVPIIRQWWNLFTN